MTTKYDKTVELLDDQGNKERVRVSRAGRLSSNSTWMERYDSISQYTLYTCKHINEYSTVG